MSEEKSWFRKALEKYDAFCEELGVNKGTCRGCVPVVKFDPEDDDEQNGNDNDGNDGGDD